MTLDTYEFISLGFDCSTAAVLRTLNLRKYALPFDWVVSSKKGIIECFKNDFADYHQNVRLSPAKTRVVDRLGFEFPHDYPIKSANDQGSAEEKPAGERELVSNYEEYIPDVQEKYIRRIDRLNKVLSEKQNLIILIRCNFSEAKEIRKILKKKYHLKKFLMVIATTEKKKKKDMITCNPEINGAWNDSQIWLSAINLIISRQP